MSQTTLKQQVMDLLVNYPELNKKIALLHYELEHPSQVSATEMIEAMNFAHHDSEGGHPKGAISNKTLYIALNYQNNADRKNRELSEELVEELFQLERNIKRLEYYMSFLPAKEQEIIRLLYVQRRNQQEVADALGISTWTVRKRRDDGIQKLVEMYEFVDDKQ